MKCENWENFVSTINDFPAKRSLRAKAEPKVFKSLMIALEKLLVEHFPELANKIMSYNNFVYNQVITYTFFISGREFEFGYIRLQKL